MMRKTRVLAEEAMVLLSLDIFTAACQKLDESLVDDWRRAATVEAREDAYRNQKALRDIQGMLLVFVDNAASEDARNQVKDSIFKAFIKRFSFTRKNTDQ